MYGKSQTSHGLKKSHVIVMIVVISVLSVSVYYVQYSDVASPPSPSPASSGSFFKIAYSEPQEFGYVISPVGDNVIAGAPHMKINDVKNVGVAYLFDGAIGMLLHTIDNPEPDLNKKFGTDIIPIDNGNIAIVASSSEPFDHDNPKSLQTVYVFDDVAGSLLHKMENPEPDKYDIFGRTVASVGNGNIAITASNFEGDTIRNEEKVFVFDSNTGLQVYSIDNPEPDTYDLFGDVVVPINSKIAISNLHASDDSENLALFVFENIS